jgi:hypothetical protein
MRTAASWRLQRKNSPKAAKSCPRSSSQDSNYKCYRGDLRDVSLPANHFAVTDERNREWVRIAVSGEASDGDGFAEMVPYVGGEPLSEPLRMTKLHCIDKSELPAKLADQID